MVITRVGVNLLSDGSSRAIANWNNVRSPGTTGTKVSDCIDVDSGLATGYTLTQNGAFTGALDGGQAAGTPDARFPLEFFTSLFYVGLAEDDAATFTHGNLPPGASYTVEAAASSGNASRDTTFSATGSNPSSVIYDALSGTEVATQPIVLTGTVPANGQITISNIGTSSFAYNNGWLLTIDDGVPSGPSITAADNITDETQPATVTLAGNTAAPTAITINGTAATGITDEGAGVYSYAPPLIADDATATLEVTVDGQTLTTTRSYANSYPYELVTHGTPNANSIFSGTQFATNGPVEWGVVTDYNPAIVIVDHAAMDVAEDELNDVGLHSTEVAAGTTTATYKYFVPESGATGTWQSEITVAAAVVPQGVIAIGTITFDDTTASVPFTYSLSDQTGFEYSLDGGAWTSTTSPVSLSGLTEQTLYSISIRAVNATGPGTAAIDTFTTSATPQVPQGVISVGTLSLTDVSASVEFSYNAADQTGFEYRLGAGSYQAATSPIDIASLTPDTPYTGDIRAVNAVGAGTPTPFEFTTLATFTPPAPSVPGLGRRGFLRSTVRGTVNSIVGGVSA